MIYVCSYTFLKIRKEGRKSKCTIDTPRYPGYSWFLYDTEKKAFHRLPRYTSATLATLAALPTPWLLGLNISQNPLCRIFNFINQPKTFLGHPGYPGCPGWIFLETICVMYQVSSVHKNKICITIHGKQVCDSILPMCAYPSYVKNRRNTSFCIALSQKMLDLYKRKKYLVQGVQGVQGYMSE